MGRDALKIVQEFFPNVNKVEDANESVTIEVTPRDQNHSQVRNHKTCAMAVACKRAMKLDGVIVSVGRAYLIRGKEATRYLVPSRVQREIVSFDRGGGFAAGEYKLYAPEPSQRLGARPEDRPETGTGKTFKRTIKHRTEGVRTILGSAGY